MLTLNNYTFRYPGDDKFLWQPLNFSFNRGEIILIKGSNGSGKTTLLYSLCGIIPQAISGEMKGEILFNQESVSNIPLKEIATEINILFQEPDKQIFMPFVEEEIAFGPENLALDREDIKRRIDNLLDRFDIVELRKRATASLSYGEKKLVVLAAILAISPAVILIDEFSAGIGDNMINRFVSYLRELKDEGKTIVLAEHHPAVREIAAKVIDLDALKYG
ncbi:MAG: energy-coupling factor ABC transporter ATP-binding protein [Candidatus Cloacimonetes bacterium]|nr:energy-coupling factor ABC transporter ATP-binding protein [Candidatus Cloacimonadota bacterium]